MLQVGEWKRTVQRFVETGCGYVPEVEEGWGKDLATLLDEREQPARDKLTAAAGRGRNQYPMVPDPWAILLPRAIQRLRAHFNHPEIEGTYSPREREQRARDLDEAKRDLLHAASLVDANDCRHYS